MGLRFRPYPGLTVAVVILTAILVALGVWQTERLSWKLNLIATMDRKMHAPPIAVDSASLKAVADDNYTHVTLKGRFDNGKEAYVFTTNPDLGAVYHVLTPFQTDAGHVYLVDRGMVPPAKRDPNTRKEGEIEGETQVVGIWRAPDPPGSFTPKPNLMNRIWYGRDLNGIALADDVRLAAPVVIEADATPVPGGWPKGGQTVVNLPNNHLSYAMTWFGLAAGLVGVYLAYHASKGRLSWA